MRRVERPAHFHAAGLSESAAEESAKEALHVEPDDRWKAHIRALIYGVQFSRDPIEDVDRVLHMVLEGRMLSGAPEQYLAAMRTALASEVPLAQLIPQEHSEETIRRFLRALEKR